MRARTSGGLEPDTCPAGGVSRVRYGMGEARELGVREVKAIDRGMDRPAVSGAVRELAVVRVPVLILALLAALLYTSGGGDSPIRPLFIVLPLIGVLSYSAYWTAVVGAVAVLDYLAVAGIHSAVEGGPSFGSILVFSLFIVVGTLGATLPVHAVVQRERAKAELEHRARLLAEQGARAEAEAVAETVRKLQRITDVALGRLSLDELLPELLRKIVDVVRSDAAAVLIAGD